MMDELTKDRLDRHEKRINDHSRRLDCLEQSNARTQVQVENLIEKMDGLITTIRWASGFFIAGMVSFFFYALQHGVLK